MVGCGDDDDDDAATAQVEEQAEEQTEQAEAEEQAEAQAQAEEEAEEQAEEEAEQAEPEEEEEEAQAEEQAVSAINFDAELRVGYGSFPPSLDVQTAGGSGGQGASNNRNFSQFFEYNPGRVIQSSGGFANFEFVDNNSGLVITVNPGATFHNGEALDAEAVQFNFERALGRAEYNPDFQGANSARAGWMGDIEVIDASSLRIGMDPPFIDAPEQSGGINYALVPKQYVIENGDAHFANNPVGHGPYQFES